MNRTLINRRQFIQLVALASTSWPLSGYSQSLAVDTNRVYLNLTDPWLTLANVQEHLFPADSQSPGAEDISALGFLRNMLDAPDTRAEEKSFILNGVSWLNDLSQKNHTQSFIQLDSTEKEIILRNIENSQAGSRWLSLMMSYLIEALLSDPVYGGNKDKKGWLWLQHTPGFPTPDSDQVYYKLSSRSRQRRRKA